MKEKHIIDVLDNSPLASLTEREMLAVRTHANGCMECRRAYEAAQLSTQLIKERSAETIEPSPFFQTRVLAALREQQANNNVPVLSRLWKSAGVLVSSMAVTTAALAALSFLAPAAGTSTSQETAALSPYSAEAVVFNQDQSDDQMTDEVLGGIYTDPDEAR